MLNKLSKKNIIEGIISGLLTSALIAILSFSINNIFLITLQPPPITNTASITENAPETQLKTKPKRQKITIKINNQLIIKYLELGPLGTYDAMFKIPRE